MTEQRIGSVKDMIETRLQNSQDSIIFQGQKYIYRGSNKNNYAFMNANTSEIRYFTAEQIA